MKSIKLIINSKIKNIILLSLCLLMFQSEIFSQIVQQENDTAINYVDVNNKKQGNWSQQYYNGEIRYTGQYKDDIPYGIFYYYYENGKQFAVMTYDDSGNSYEEFFDQNGRLKMAGFHSSDRKKIKTWNFYHDDGSLNVSLNYNNNEKIDGNIIVYYANTDSKTKEMELTYKDGKKEGRYKQFFKNGNLQKKGSYKNGLKHGYWKFYTSEKVCEAKGKYVKGEKEGVWKIFDTDTQKIIKVKYKNGHSDYDDKKIQERIELYDRIFFLL